MISEYIKYRGDIDGLRAVAVLSVIVFHINNKWMPGGFLGVDIFFVISGYLITFVLIKETTETGGISIANFYKRRIKRITPALLFVLFPTFVGATLWFSPNDLVALSESMIWSVFSAANVYFYSAVDTGYFAQSSHDLPLLHLWSLGVEEQFYILWPFGVLLLVRYIKAPSRQLSLSIVLFVISFVWAQSTINTNHSFSYYMLPTRAWELLAGGIAAQLVHAGFRTESTTSELMSLIGLLMIILSLAFVSNSDPVPGVAALPVIGGTALLILSGTSHRTRIARVLSFKGFVAIGLVSYSAYLWHWPVLAFLRYALIEIDWIFAIIVVATILGLATVSYFLVETPLRRTEAGPRSVLVGYFIIPAIVTTVASVITIQAVNNKREFIFPWAELSDLNSSILPTGEYVYSCDSSSKEILSADRCVYPQTSASSQADAFLIGDSNAAHYLGMIRVFAKHYGFSVRNATKSACPPVIGGEFEWISQSRRASCSRYRYQIFDEAKKYSTVIVGASWNYYYPRDGFRERFEATLAQLSEGSANIILLGKTPVFPSYSKECEIRSIRLAHLNCSTRFNQINKESTQKYNQWLRRIAERHSNVEYFGISNQLCQGNQCSPYLNGKPVFYNSGHLSMKGSEQIGENLLRSQDPMLMVFEHIEGH